MRWEGEQESSNVEDRRGRGGGFGMPGGIRGGGIGVGTVVIALLGAWLFGINPMTVIEILGGGEPAIEQPQRSPAPPGPSGQQSAGTDDREARFASVVLASTEQVWTKLLAGRYPAPRLVLYDGMTPTACGSGNAAAGPFYCPADRSLYIDLAFNRVLRDKLGAAGDTAQAYVIAHEVGHHIQNITGQMDQVQSARSRAGERQSNDLSVRLEMQADCYAGVWARQAEQSRKWLEPGDIEEAMRAAQAVGDDRIQRSTRGVVVPESFTHGSSEQRARWFKVGLQRGSPDDCDTFNTRNP